MRQAYDKVFLNDDLVGPKSPTSLWVYQLAQQQQAPKDPNGKRAIFTDNFYTRHVFAKRYLRQVCIYAMYMMTILCS